METIKFNGKDYHKLQTEGFASQYCFPFALKMCTGSGLDIGYSKPEWKFPGAVGIDDNKICDANGIETDSIYNAMNLPEGQYDYLISSHMLEHYNGRFQELIEYWLTKVKKSGLIFLYLPNCFEQDYWAWGNKKHIHVLNPELMKKYCQYLVDNKIIQRFTVTDGFDLNSSFYCIIEN